MTPAEFDTRRRQLGLSIGETAALCLPPDADTPERTVNHWIGGLRALDDDQGRAAVAAIATLADRMDAWADAQVAAARAAGAATWRMLRWRRVDAMAAHPDDPGLPVGPHAVAVAWAADALADLGIGVEINWAA